LTPRSQAASLSHLCATVTKQYNFGTSASWEDNRRSGVALAVRHRQSGITTYGLTALEWEMSCPPTLRLEYGVLSELQVC